MTRRASFGRAALVLAAVLVADQATKALVRSGVRPGDSDSVLPGLSIVHVRNDGIAFGALGGGRSVVVVIVALALVGLLVFFVRHARSRLVWLPTGLLLGGALGNVVDRVRDGAVTDFLKIPFWPAFNLADTAISIGVLALLYALDVARDRS